MVDKLLKIRVAQAGCNNNFLRVTYGEGVTFVSQHIFVDAEQSLHKRTIYSDAGRIGTTASLWVLFRRHCSRWSWCTGTCIEPPSS